MVLPLSPQLSHLPPLPLQEINYLWEYLSTVNKEEVELYSQADPNYHLSKDLSQTDWSMLGQYSLRGTKSPLQGLSSWFHDHSMHLRSIFSIPLFQPLLWSISLLRWLIHSVIIYSCLDFLYKLLHLQLLGSQFWSSLLKINDTYLLRETLCKASCDDFCYTSWH